MGCVDGAHERRKAPGWQAWLVAAAGAALIVWSLHRGATGPNRVLDLAQPTEKLAFTTDGRRLVAVGAGRAVAWDTSTWNELPPGVTLPVPTDPAFSPDGKLRAVKGHAADKPRVRVLDVLTGRPVQEKEVKSRLSGASVTAVALGERWLAAAYGNAEESEVHLWDVGALRP
ncbi:MAG: hypothetical protein HY553_10825 [Elusimicrobia bacterium]|nr:hypothetical protein [Elusimicrobiota bacterium]